jgi:hypothetical protein
MHGGVEVDGLLGDLFTEGCRSSLESWERMNYHYHGDFVLFDVAQER